MAPLSQIGTYYDDDVLGFPQFAYVYDVLYVSWPCLNTPISLLKVRKELNVWHIHAIYQFYVMYFFLLLYIFIMTLFSQ